MFVFYPRHIFPFHFTTWRHEHRSKLPSVLFYVFLTTTQSAFAPFPSSTAATQILTSPISLYLLHHLPHFSPPFCHLHPLVPEAVWYMMKCTYWETLVPIFIFLYLPPLWSVSVINAGPGTIKGREKHQHGGLGEEWRRPREQREVVHRLSAPVNTRVRVGGKDKVCQGVIYYTHSIKWQTKGQRTLRWSKNANDKKNAKSQVFLVTINLFPFRCNNPSFFFPFSLWSWGATGLNDLGCQHLPSLTLDAVTWQILRFSLLSPQWPQLWH